MGLNRMGPGLATIIRWLLSRPGIKYKYSESKYKYTRTYTQDAFKIQYKYEHFKKYF